MQFSSVVLPAPLGPMMPTMSPLAISKFTPSTAATPPKRLVTPRSSSCGTAPSGAPANSRRSLGVRGVFTARSREASGANTPGSAGCDRRDEREVERDRQAAAQKLDEQLQEDGAGRRAEHSARAAEQRHQDHLDVVLDRKYVVLVDEDVPLREDPTRQARQGRGQREGRNLVGGGVNAEH